MNKIAKNICVDAGLILISDPSFYEKWGGQLSEDDRLYKVFKVKNGKYKVKSMIPKTWNGKVQDEGVIEITSGKMIVSDPCYHFNGDNEWMTLLDKTDYMKDPIPGCLVLDKMGGDGTYNVHINLEEINV